MQTVELLPADLALVQHAKAIISKRYRADHHHVGAALRTRLGQIVTGVHVEANVSRVTVCGEAIAIGRAITEGLVDLDTIVAVRRDDHDPTLFYVVSPCGVCREMINDYMPDGFCICVEHDQLKKVPVVELLAGKYSRDARVRA